MFTKSDSSKTKRISPAHEEADQQKSAYGKKMPAVAPVQKMAEEDDAVQGKFETVQRQELAEEEEPVQGKFETVQRQEMAEEEEPVQGKFETVQRQEMAEEEEPVQGKFETVQRQEMAEEEEPVQGKFAPAIQRKETSAPANNTGMPSTLKSGIENMSGYNMDDVKVHYNSSKPAQLKAHAYAQGTDIHIGPGQEQHLPHEAWHIVQQKQGRVKPTLQMKGNVPVNDDTGLETEADVMGAKALSIGQQSPVQKKAFTRNLSSLPPGLAPLQGGFMDKMKDFFKRGGTKISDGASSAKTAITTGVDDAKNSEKLTNNALGNAVPVALGGLGAKTAFSAIRDQKVDTSASIPGGLVGAGLGGLGMVMGGKEIHSAYKTGDKRRAINGALDVVGGGIGTAGGIASMVGGAAVPGLGLAAAGFDTARNVGNAIYTDSQKKTLEAQHKDLAAKGGNVTMDTLTTGKNATDSNMMHQYQKLQIAKRAAGVREKQRNRAIVNSVASGVETAGHATVVGAGVTGVGAAVGAGLIAGGKGIKAGFGLGRYIKQKGKDKGWWGKGANSMDTTAGKAQDTMSFIAHSMDNIADEGVQKSLYNMGANKELIAKLQKMSTDKPDENASAEDKLKNKTERQDIIGELTALYRKR